MATFAPTLNDVNPKDWTKDSKPISDLTSDKSAAIAISGAADIFGEAVKVTDSAFKDTIKKDVETGVDNLRDAYTESLKQTRNMQLAASDKSLVPDAPNANAPVQLQSGLDRIKQIGTALTQNGGKVNDTLYTGALNSLAKQLRSQYPGYRDYIDEQIQSVSGVNPANAFMKNLMEDINRSAENNKTENNAVKAQLRGLAETGFQDANGVKASDVYALHDKGLVDNNGVQTWINSSKSLEWNNKQREQARKNRLEDEADATTNATKDLSTIASQTINHAWTTMTVGKGTDTAAGLFKFINENAGNQQVTDEKSTAVGQQLVALRNQTFASVWAEANKGRYNSSLVSKLGGDPDKAKKIIEGQFATWDNAIQSVFKGEWGAAYSHMNFNKAISADTTNILYNAPDEEVRRYNRMVGSINQISPQFAKDFFQSMLMSDVPEREKEWLKTQSMQLLTQPGQPQGKLTTAQGTLDAARAANVTSPKTFSKVMDNVNMVADPRIGEEQRLNAARGFFDPTYNTGLLSDKNFRKDYYDPATKREIPGKYSVWTRLAAPNVAAGVADLNKAHPEIGPMYSSMMSREFGEQLFNREIRDLADAEASSKWNIKFTDDGKNAPRFEITNRDGSPLSGLQATEINAPVRAINRLNIGLSGLHNVYNATGGDSNNRILQTMYKYGYVPEKTKFNPGTTSPQIQDIPSMIWNAVTGSQSHKVQEQSDEMRK